jgi:hypothetical protein
MIDLTPFNVINWICLGKTDTGQLVWQATHIETGRIVFAVELFYNPLNVHLPKTGLVSLQWLLEKPQDIEHV